VAHNLIVDYYRRQPARELVPLDDVDIANDDDDSELHLEQKTQVARARAALQRLTPLQQQVVVLRFLEALSIEEVVEVIGRTGGAVKALQHRALNSLRRILEEEYET